MAKKLLLPILLLLCSLSYGQNFLASDTSLGYVIPAGTQATLTLSGVTTISADTSLPEGWTRITDSATISFFNSLPERMRIQDSINAAHHINYRYYDTCQCKYKKGFKFRNYAYPNREVYSTITGMKVGKNWIRCLYTTRDMTKINGQWLQVGGTDTRENEMYIDLYTSKAYADEVGRSSGQFIVHMDSLTIPPRGAYTYLKLKDSYTQPYFDGEESFKDVCEHWDWLENEFKR
jgi:hypothetical protein